MIIKSMSRKEPTFGQLAAYMSSEKSDSRYDIHHGCIAGSDEAIAKEFYANSELLAKRKNANYLYHEIVSISTEGIQDRKALKESLQKIALRYIQHRCPQNMVYGCLHEDHSEHLHYHLMISANEKFDDTRHFLTRKKFDQVKRDLEAYVLKNYPQLKQKKIMTAVSQNEKMSIKGDAMKRRTGSLPQREEVSQLIQDAMAQTNSMENFCFFLNEQGYDFYVRGKNFGVKVTHENGKTKSYRFSTLGLHDEFQAFQDGQNKKSEEVEADAQKSDLKNSGGAGEKEKYRAKVVHERKASKPREVEPDENVSSKKQVMEPSPKQEVEQESEQQAEQTAEQKIDAVRQEFQKMTEKKRQSQNSQQGPKQSQ